MNGVNGAITLAKPTKISRVVETAELRSCSLSLNPPSADRATGLAKSGLADLKRSRDRRTYQLDKSSMNSSIG